MNKEQKEALSTLKARRELHEKHYSRCKDPAVRNVLMAIGRVNIEDAMYKCKVAGIADEELQKYSI